MTAATTVVAPLANPFVQLWDDIQTEAGKIETGLEALAVTVETNAVAAIEDVFKIGAPLAVAAIMQQVPLLISGTEKFGNAVTSVAQDLQSKLGPIAIADVQTLVQTTFTGLTKIASAA